MRLLQQEKGAAGLADPALQVRQPGRARLGSLVGADEVVDREGRAGSSPRMGTAAEHADSDGEEVEHQIATDEIVYVADPPGVTPGAGRRKEEEAGRLATELSYADQRRVEIARALAAHPHLVLFDEPAAGMNPTEKLELVAIIRKIRDLGIELTRSLKS